MRKPLVDVEQVLVNDKLRYTLNSKKIFIIAGEASGDLHGAEFVKELLALNPHLEIYAWGGDKMQAAGAKILKHYKDLAFMGFWEVLKNLGTIFKNFKQIKSEIKQIQPDAVILIDYPGFNMRLLPWLYAHQFKIYYYIAPQAWAWKAKRSHQLARYVNHLFVILPFESEFFKKYDIPVSFVGHPLLQSIEKEHIEKKGNHIAILPGSRKQEIESILPVLLQMKDHFPYYTFQIAALRYLGADYYQKFIKDKDVELIWDAPLEVLKRADLALVASGTATLQAALLDAPQIVCYKTTPINYFLAKKLIQVPYISLVNLIMQKEVVKELIQEDLNPTQLYQEMKALLLGNKREVLLMEYQKLKTAIGSKNASETVAKHILNEL
jgi:lipid-A-disaccharide synthase